MNAVDQITARARTLAKLRKDDRYRQRRATLIRTYGDLMTAHAVLTDVLQDFEEYLNREQLREQQPATTTGE